MNASLKDGSRFSVLEGLSQKLYANKTSSAPKWEGFIILMVNKAIMNSFISMIANVEMICSIERLNEMQVEVVEMTEHFPPPPPPPKKKQQYHLIVISLAIAISLNNKSVVFFFLIKPLKHN